MSNYKVGDKFIIEIDKIFKQDGETLYRAKGMKSLVFDEYGLNILKPLEDETMKLLRENAELKERMQKDIDKICDLCSRNDALDVARADGAEKAWKLAQKLRYMDYEDKVECFDLEYDGKEKWIEIMEKYTYTEAAAKVEDWKRQKEEIRVGDVLLSNNIREKCVVTAKHDGIFTLLWNDGSSGNYGEKAVREYKKVGHIDVDAWLAQIGGER